MFRLSQGLKHIKHMVKGWNKHVFGDVFHQKWVVVDKLGELQMKMEEGDNSILTGQQEKEERVEWEKILKKEEVLWKQKSRIQWLAKGGQNTSFFHVPALKHQKRNQIKKLKNEVGIEVSNPVQIGRLATNHFQQAYSLLDEVPTPGLVDMLLDPLPTPINREDNISILRAVTYEEVHSVVFSMGAFKAPGLDGFPLDFFQTFWEIVGGGSYPCY